jgi:hypothetical protein
MLGQPEPGPQTAIPPPRGADAASGGAAPRGPNQLWSALLARVLQLPQTDWRDPSILRLVAAGGRASEILGSILDKIEASPGISTARLLEQFRDASFFPRLMQLASLPLGGEEPELSRRVALDSADRLFREHCRERMRSLSSQADRPLEPKEIEELRRLQALLAQGEGMGKQGGISVSPARLTPVGGLKTWLTAPTSAEGRGSRAGNFTGAASGSSLPHGIAAFGRVTSPQ